MNVVTGVVAPFRERVRAATDGEYVTAFLVSPGFTGAALALVLSVSLRRRKRAAWITATVLAAGYTVILVSTLSAVPGLPRARLQLGVPRGDRALPHRAARLPHAVQRPRRSARNALARPDQPGGGRRDRRRRRHAARPRHRPQPPREWGASPRYAAIRVLTVSGLFDLPGVTVPGWTDLAVNVLSVALMLVVLLAFFRSPRGRARLLPADERRLRALLRAYGRPDPFGYLALRRDRSVSWTPDRDAAVVYRVVNGVALAAGDPLGPPTSWPAAIATWLTLTRRHAWTPAVVNASPEASQAYASAGFHSFPAGADGTVGVRDFAHAAGAAPTAGGPTAGGARAGEGRTGPEGGSLGSRRVGVRAAGGAGARDAGGLVAAYRMVADAGYQGVYRRQGEVGEEEWRRLGHLAEAWRRRPAERGRAAGLGRLGDPADGDCLVAECLDPNGRTCALLRFVPWAGDGLTLDLVRYDRDSGRTPVDFLLTGLLLTAAGPAPGPLAGVTRVSLGTTWGRPRARPAYEAYKPGRKPRSLLYERRLDLPRVATATLLADRTA